MKRANMYNANYIEDDNKPHQDAFVVSSSIPGEGKDTRLLSCNQILVMYLCLCAQPECGKPIRSWIPKQTKLKV